MQCVLRFDRMNLGASGSKAWAFRQCAKLPTNDANGKNELEENSTDQCQHRFWWHLRILLTGPLCFLSLASQLALFASYLEVVIN